MSRWARRLPKHFQRDAVNVLVVLSHQLDCPLHDLLLKARTWVVNPVTTKTPRLRKQKHNIAYEKNDDSIENYVHHLHTSVAVLTEDIVNESHLYGSKFRMDSVNRPANFKIISNKTVNSTPYLVCVRVCQVTIPNYSTHLFFTISILFKATQKNMYFLMKW